MNRGKFLGEGKTGWQLIFFWIHELGITPTAIASAVTAAVPVALSTSEYFFCSMIWAACRLGEFRR